MDGAAAQNPSARGDSATAGRNSATGASVGNSGTDAGTGTAANDTPENDIAADDTGTGDTAASGLSRRELDILDFERKWWKYAGAKEEAIRELFGLSATRYYQVLNAVVDRPEALAADPMLVKRLRRLRASRQKSRAARRLGFQV